MGMLGQLNTLVSFMFWQMGWTDQIIENSHTSAVSKSKPTNVLPTTQSQCHYVTVPR